MSTLRGTRVAAAAFAAVLAVVVSGCGDTNVSASSGAASSTTAAAGAADGDWLLRFVTAEGADGEQARSVYIRYNPTTGAAAAQSLPRVTASDARQDEQALLVDAGHTRAILDTGIPKDQQKTGKLVVYSVTTAATETVDIRALTGKPDLRAVAWAFDPVAAAVLRVVDATGGIWKVDLTAHTATQEGQLPHRSGWIFGNGFDKNSGEPYIESIDSDATDPAGNGDSDTRPVQRQGGTVLRYDGDTLDGLPKPPCGFAGGFKFADGSAWLFCADTPSITAYRVDKGGSKWVASGAASPKIVPGVAADLTFALPPVS